MENEDLNKSDLETAISHLIKKFDSKLTPEQKNIVLKEFLNYERMRRERKERTEMLHKMEAEKQRTNLYSFLNGDDIGV